MLHSPCLVILFLSNTSQPWKDSAGKKVIMMTKELYLALYGERMIMKKTEIDLTVAIPL